jgi:hypothetical protein
MPELPPKNQNIREADEVEQMGEGLRVATILGSDFVANVAIALHRRIVKGLRAEGLDGGNWRSRYLHGGDAEKTAKLIVEPLHALAQDLYNAAVNATIFKRRFKTMYVDAIMAAREAKTDDDVVVVK